MATSSSSQSKKEHSTTLPKPKEKEKEKGKDKPHPIAAPETPDPNQPIRASHLHLKPVPRPGEKSVYTSLTPQQMTDISHSQIVPREISEMETNPDLAESKDEEEEKEKESSKGGGTTDEEEEEEESASGSDSQSQSQTESESEREELESAKVNKEGGPKPHPFEPDDESLDLDVVSPPKTGPRPFPFVPNSPGKYKVDMNTSSLAEIADDETATATTTAEETATDELLTSRGLPFMSSGGGDILSVSRVGKGKDEEKASPPKKKEKRTNLSIDERMEELEAKVEIRDLQIGKLTGRLVTLEKERDIQNETVSLIKTQLSDLQKTVSKLSKMGEFSLFFFSIFLDGQRIYT